MKRLVCVVEGKGEVQAVPQLCWSVFQYLGIEGWLVDKEPIRQPRSKLVRREDIARAVALARARKADATLILCDADDDCPAKWGPDALSAIPSFMKGAAVMAVREYETWLLASFPNVDDSDLRKRDAKKLLEKLVPGYLPTTHQLTVTRRLDVVHVRRRSDSFDKLVRDLARLCGVTPPTR